MTALKLLSLDYNQIDAKACEHLAPALAKMTALETLNLWDNQIDAKTCEHLAPAFAQMTALKSRGSLLPCV
jgi:Ran GTPase-activating protein (RanGAP) involved in mRNA processing and transport